MWRGVRPRSSSRHRWLRTLVIAAVCAFVAAWPSVTEASGLVDPRLRFREVRTPHFVIYFHQGEEPLARRLASLVESVRDSVATSLGGSAPLLTHVVLADQSEQANGWATPLPRDIVFLHAAVPSGADNIGRTDDWLRLVFTHEYTHIVHLDRSRGWARLVRGIFGRSALAYPNLSLPAWQIEGIATWNESAIVGEGRWHAGDFRAIERVATRDGRALTMDRANGGLIGWPDGHAQYAAGLGFHGYLASTYGDASLARLADASARQLPFLGARAFRKVYGRSLGSLWHDYQADVRASTTATRPDTSGATRLTHVGNVVSGPRFAPPTCGSCAAEIVYSARTPDAYPELREVSADGSNDRHLTTRYLGSTVGVAGEVVIFDQQELRRGLGLYSDLFTFDRRTGDVQALTTESRLQDPDLSPDGRRVAAVREGAGRRELVVTTLERTDAASSALRLGAVAVLRGDAHAQYSAPRWSPDGTRLAVERRVLGYLPDVAIVDAASGDVLQALADASTRVVTPTWRPDGRAVVAAADFDEHPFDLYEFPLDGGPIRRLTTSDGATWPDVSADGAQLTYVRYGVDGSDVFVQPYAPMPGAVRPLQPRTTPRLADGDTVAPRIEPLASTGYRPLDTIGPTTWTPLALSDANQSRAGLFIYGADVLVRHAYVASLSWRIDSPVVARSISAGRPDWSVSYAYTRWRPNWFMSASNETVFRTATNEATSERIGVMGTRREVEGGVYLPLAHVRRSAQLMTSVVRSDATYLLPSRDLQTTLVSTRVAGAVDTSRRYGYGISREHGVQIGSTLELTREALGADADATTGTVDVRLYLPGAARHQVLALRAAGGRSTGATRAVQSFSAGAVGASPSVIDFSASALGLFRGETGGALAGTQIVVGNAEYRIPLARIERGHGTWPLLLRQMHASVFLDAAQVRGGEHVDSGWRRAAGVELNVDVVAGFSLPFALTVGGAWTDRAASATSVSAYVRVGRAF